MGDHSLATYGEEEGYEDYGQYDADQGYDASFTGADGNKGEELREPSDLLRFVVETYDTSPGARRYQCALCSKFSHNGRAHVRNHVESVHYPSAFSYNCDQCDKSFPSKSNVQLHRSRVHNQ